MSNVFFLYPVFVLKHISFILLQFILAHSILWCSISYFLNNSFCLQEPFLQSEFAKIYVFSGLTFISVGLIGLAINSLLFHNAKNYNSSVNNEELPGITKVPQVIPLPEVPKEEVKDSLFKFVKYEFDYSPSKREPINALIDPVSKDRLLQILKEIETSRAIIRRYENMFSKPDEDLENDAEKIYGRFEYFKEDVYNGAHEERFGDWFYASSVLDKYQKTLTSLMLGLIEKPWEHIDEDMEAPWDLEIWQRYMFESHKNFFIANDVLTYTDHLVQLYLGRPDKFNKIKPIWDLIPNDGPRLKVIYRWEEIVKVASLQKEQNIVDENFLKGKDLHQEGASTPKIKEESIELEPTLGSFTLFFSELKKYIAFYFW